MKQLLTGQLVNIAERDVKDIDEEAFRNGQVRARFYGTLLVPEDSQYLQQVKNAGTERDELAQLDVAQEMIDQLHIIKMYLDSAKARAEVCHAPNEGVMLYEYALKLMANWERTCCSTC